MQRESVSEFRTKREEAYSYIRQQTDFEPDYLIILGSGLGNLADEIDAHDEIPYSDIPHFPESTVEGHEGSLLLGTLKGQNIAAMQGRFHYYEGYSMQQIAFPVRLVEQLGAGTLIVSNSCGGMDPNYKRGDIMLINDHINMLGDNPLIGPNDDELGPRFPDMSDPYTKELRDIAEQVALDEGIKMHEGVYLALSGPTMETKSEYRYLRMIGGDVVGMSTVPEVIAAVHMGMEVLGLSVVTDECVPHSLEPVSHEEIVAAAKVAEPKMTEIIKGFLGRI